MNDLVIVDTNILISALISKNEKILQTLSSSNTSFVSTNYIVVELFKHSHRIQKKSRLSTEQLIELLGIIIGQIKLLDDGLISVSSWVEAARLCRGEDMNDLAFLALALELKGKLWTRDKRLKLHLIRNGYSNFFEI
ncbi:MAG: PIN domain-containing protein [Pyrinomonadaceae bacterium]